jgi:hypothetical protein
MTQRRVWFLLVDEKGEALRGTTTSSVHIPTSYVIDQFRDAVKEKCDRQGDDLKGILASKLVVYASKEDFEAKNALEEDEEIKNRGTAKANALVVVVPTVAGAIPPKMLNTSYDLLQLVLPQVLTNAPTSLSARNQDFKRNLCEFYGCFCRKKRWIQCMVLDIAFPKVLVTAAHLFRRSNEYLAVPLMQIEDIDDTRNGMLMFKPLKYAFDHFQISFIAEEDGNSFILKLFDQSLQATLLIDLITDKNQRQVLINAVSNENLDNRCTYNLQTTFGEIDGKRITFYSPNRPFNRCLNLQARLAYMIALKKGSIDASYQFKDFWSEGMSLEDKMEIFQRSISANLF